MADFAKFCPLDLGKSGRFPRNLRCSMPTSSRSKTAACREMMLSYVIQIRQFLGGYCCELC